MFLNLLYVRKPTEKILSQIFCQSFIEQTNYLLIIQSDEKEYVIGKEERECSLGSLKYIS